MENIKSIIFDFGGVILDIDYDKTSRAFKDIGVTNFDEMYSQQKADPLFQHLEEGKIGEQEFYDAFRIAADLPLLNEEIKTSWNAMLLHFRKEALNTLVAIRPKYKLYLLSNTNIIHHTAFNKIYKEEIGERSLSGYFDKAYFSDVIGHRKPGKEAYEYVLKENNLSPAETLFIDDTIQNIDAANALGLQTIFLKQGMRVEDLDL